MYAEAISEMLQSARKQRAERIHRRAWANTRQIFEHVLSALEKLHQTDRELDRPSIKEVVNRINGHVGTPAPQSVSKAKNSRQLHDALLEWEESLSTQVGS
ncbi:MAG: hypothetical protein ACREP9_11745, partial [Candidatus Dormibacteraceae bacterium]